MEKKIKDLKRCIRVVKKSRIKWLYGELKFLKICFRTINSINLPLDNEEERKLLNDCVKQYDASIALIEKDFISKFRREI